MRSSTVTLPGCTALPCRVSAATWKPPGRSCRPASRRPCASWTTSAGEAALFTWLCQICRREIVDHLRAHRRYADRVVLIDDQPDLRAAIESLEAPDEYDLVKTYGRAEVGRLVQAVLDRLPARYGDALEWKYVEGHSVEEIGARLGIGHAAAQSLLARARLAFRDALERVFGSTAADVAATLEVP